MASLPPGVLARVQHHAMAEHATLALIGRHLDYQRLADILDASSRRQDLDPLARHEMRRWSRGPAGQQRDGVPAHAFPAEKIRQPGRLPQRDFDLGRELGQTPAHGHPPAGTGVLLTPGDSRADWLHAGQALHRMLVYAASNWAFASLYTQPLEAATIRDLIRERLGLHGAPQIILQFGRGRHHPRHSTPGCPGSHGAMKRTQASCRRCGGSLLPFVPAAGRPLAAAFDGDTVRLS